MLEKTKRQLASPGLPVKWLFKMMHVTFSDSFTTIIAVKFMKVGVYTEVCLLCLDQLHSQGKLLTIQHLRGQKLPSTCEWMQIFAEQH